MGAAAADFDNDGWQDLLVTAVGQNRLFRNTGKGTFVDVTARAGLGNRDWASARRRCGSTTTATAGWICSSATTCAGRPRPTCSAAWTASRRRTARRRRIAARRRGSSAIAATAPSRTSRRRPDCSTRRRSRWASRWSSTTRTPGPMSSSPTTRSPTSSIATTATARSPSSGLKAGLALSEEGRARAGMGVDAADVDNSGATTVVVTNFSGEMLGLYRPVGDGQFQDAAPRSEVGRATRQTLGLRLLLLRRRSRRPAGPARRQRPHRRHVHPVQQPRRLRGAAAPVPQPRARPVHGRRRRPSAARSRSRRSAAAPRSPTSMATSTSTSSSRPTADRRRSIATTSAPGNRALRLRCAAPRRTATASARACASSPGGSDTHDGEDRHRATCRSPSCRSLSAWARGRGPTAS